jgi:hypothetical protein
MPVLLEAISVIIRAETILAKFPGGFEGYAAQVPNKTLCSDGELIRVGLLTPEETRSYCEQLENKGLTSLAENGESLDIAVVDQLRGPLAPCAWLELGEMTCVEEGQERGRIRAARLVGSAQHQVVTPLGWSWDESMSRHFSAAADAALAEMPAAGGKDN